MNLYLTHKCNRGCAFCFARKIVSEGGVDINEILTIEDVEKLLRHYQKDLEVVGLLGGEPFLYPHLGELLKLLDKYTKDLNIKKFDLAVDFGWYYFLTKPFFYILDYLYKCRFRRQKE